MMPPAILAFLDRANVAHAGTRDRDLVPHGHRVSGWRVGPDARTLTVLVPEVSTAHLLASVEDNGWFTLTAEEYPAHEAYQFKGRYVRHQAVQPEDFGIAERVRRRFMRMTRGHEAGRAGRRGYRPARQP
jgi:hypothetical protein